MLCFSPRPSSSEWSKSGFRKKRTHLCLSAQNETLINSSGENTEFKWHCFPLQPYFISKKKIHIAEHLNHKKSGAKTCWMPFKQKSFCPNKKSYQGSLGVHSSACCLPFRRLSGMLMFLPNTLVFASLSLVLYLWISCSACLHDNPVTTNFISCLEIPKLILVICCAWRISNLHSFPLLSCLPGQTFVKSGFVIRTENTLVY